jgi:hypothetical protein
MNECAPEAKSVCFVHIYVICTIAQNITYRCLISVRRLNTKIITISYPSSNMLQDESISNYCTRYRYYKYNYSTKMALLDNLRFLFELLVVTQQQVWMVYLSIFSHHYVIWSSTTMVQQDIRSQCSSYEVCYLLVITYVSPSLSLHICSCISITHLLVSLHLCFTMLHFRTK